MAGAALVAGALAAAAFLAGAFVAGAFVAGAFFAGADFPAGVDFLAGPFAGVALAVARFADRLTAAFLAGVDFLAGAALVADRLADALAAVCAFLAGAALVAPAGDFFTAVNSTSFEGSARLSCTASGHCGTTVPPTSTSG